MHNCKTAHPGKTHRRRNRRLKRDLDPIRVTAGPATTEDHATKIKADMRERRDEQQRDRRDASVQATSQHPSDNTRRIEVAPASAMKNPVAWLKKRFTRKTG